DLLAGAHLLQRGGVDDLQQLSDEELIGEDGELLDEMLQFLVGRFSLLEPARVGVVLDDAIVEQVAVDLGEEVAEVIDLSLGQLAAATLTLDGLGDVEAAGSCRAHLSHETVPPERER